MDTNKNADFINSVASGERIPCPQCGSPNRPNGKFCVYCGSTLNFQNEAQAEPTQTTTKPTQSNTPLKDAFATTKTQSPAPAFAPIKSSQTEPNASAEKEKSTSPAFPCANKADKTQSHTAKSEPIKQTKNAAPAFAPVPKVTENVNKYEEPESVFAQGLPKWDLEPPQIKVRRR